MKRLKMLHFALAGTIAFGSLLRLSNFSSAASICDEISSHARKYAGTKITSFGSGDFVSYILKKEGINTPSNLNDLSREGTRILDKEQLEKETSSFSGQAVRI